MKDRIVFASIALFALSAVLADDYVDKADADGDGYVSLYELRAAHFADPEFNRRIEQAFDRYDTNKDGRISEQERRAARAVGRTDSQTDNNSLDHRYDARTPTAGAVADPAGGSYPARQTAEGSNRSAASVPAAEVNRSAAPAPVAEVNRGLSIDTRLTPGSATRRGEATDPTTRESANPRARDSQSTAAAGVDGRYQSWLSEIDTDGNGGASMEELIANGDGQPWFRDQEFKAADRNGDGKLDSAELGLLVQSIERRQR